MRQNASTWIPGFHIDRAPHSPLALILWPSGGLVRDITLVVGGSLFVALLAQISIPLPFTVVPITGQTLAVALTAAFLGSKRGTLALLTYLAEGAAGLPFWAGGAGGWLKLIGPTGGYLIGFVVAAFLVGFLCEKGWDRHVISAALAFLLGDAIVFVFGLLGLARFVAPNQVFAQGLFPFIPGDLIKITLAALVITGTWKVVEKRKRLS
jgi:biotin transport system substrate-specific component